MRYIQILATFLAYTLALSPKLGALEHSIPNVVTSIIPFYALTASVMEGTQNKPHLLIKNAQSPHDYALKPSDLTLLKAADVIFWGGEGLEGFLVKVLNPENLPNATIIALSKAPKLLLLPVRHSPSFEPHEHDHSDHIHSVDMHFWLEPNNAILLTKYIASILSKVDPNNKILYFRNAEKFEIKMKALDKKISKLLKTIKAEPFLVFHDAYQYFQHHYNLNGVGAITLNPEIPPSAKRLQAIRNKILSSKVHCVFQEPQFQSKLIQNLASELKINIGELDPLGSNSHLDPNGYYLLMDNLALALSACLKK